MKNQFVYCKHCKRGREHSNEFIEDKNETVIFEKTCLSCENPIPEKIEISKEAYEKFCI